MYQYSTRLVSDEKTPQHQQVPRGETNGVSES